MRPAFWVELVAANQSTASVLSSMLAASPSAICGFVIGGKAVACVCFHQCNAVLSTLTWCWPALLQGFGTTLTVTYSTTEPKFNTLAGAMRVLVTPAEMRLTVSRLSFFAVRHCCIDGHMCYTCSYDAQRARAMRLLMSGREKVMRQIDGHSTPCQQTPASRW